MYDGYVFFCDKSSLQQCLSQKRYMCAGKKTELEDLEAGAVVFFYNEQEKTLVGPFTTLEEGDELDAGTWVEQVDENNMPYDDVKVTWEDLHIIKNAADELPFLKDLKTCRLTTTQTQRILDLLEKGEPYIDELK